MVGGAELRASKARETSRGVRGHPPRKILKSRVPEMAFPAFLGKSLQNPKRYKTFTVTYTTFTSPSAPKAGGAQPPFFPLLQSWGGFSPPAPPVPPPMLIIAYYTNRLCLQYLFTGLRLLLALGKHLVEQGICGRFTYWTGYTFRIILSVYTIVFSCCIKNSLKPGLYFPRCL